MIGFTLKRSLLVLVNIIPRIVVRQVSAPSKKAYFAAGEMRSDYVPVDEEHPTLPHDSYASPKVCSEVTARAFQHRSGIYI